ncbi:MAG: stage 0 sporulation family protein [Chloroflexota bacterium]
MARIVGVRFKRAGKVYYFDPGELSPKVDDQVVVRTSRGLALGQVVKAPRQVEQAELKEPLEPVVRLAEPEDIKRAQELEPREREALEECARLVEKLNLPMKLVSAEYNLEGNRVTILFGAEERVDFRELVRELSGRLKVRVELRQIGPRDEAKLLGGFGRCGRPLCCLGFLNEFAPISIKMAKEQEVPLNPMKISGVCGRLLCCLSYESDFYREMKEKLPKEGQQVSTPTGMATVVGSNPLKETVMVELESSMLVELPVSQVTLVGEILTKPRRLKRKLNTAEDNNR